MSLVKETFPVLEMTCAACAVSVESMLKSAKGVKDAGVNFASQTAWVEYDPIQAPRTSLQQTVRSIGYDLVIDTENSKAITATAQQQHYHNLRRRTVWAGALSLPVVIIGMFWMDLPYANWIMMALSTPVVFYFGRNFFVNAWKQARNGRANMDTLVALSTGVAWVFSVFNTIYPEFWHARGIHPHVYFEAAAVVIAFISLGKLLEEKAKAGTSAALKKLIGLQPDTVTIVHQDGAYEDIPVVQVKVDDILLVKPGEKVPVDGMVSEGASYVDESMITGEPVAVLKATGARVFAGTINQKGSFRFRADKVGGDTVLAQIIKMVQEAQGSKAPVQKLVDKIAGIFVPVVIGIALLTFAAWMIWGGENAFTHALLTAVTVLVIACPCALGLATPTAIMVGVGKGAENHILIRDAESLELAHKVTAIVLDKTGTITEGKPEVTDLILTSREPDQAKAILLAIEQQSEHPLAAAVVEYLGKENLPAITVGAVESVTGKGVRSTYAGKTWGVGNLALLQELGVPVSAAQQAQLTALQQQAKTVVLLSADKSLEAIIAITDKVKAGSVAAVRSLQDQGISVYMLTGDNQHTAAAVAREAGIRQFRAEVLPSDKAAFVAQLQHKGDIVAMVGDGINDSQALAQADVSIAMGKGSDIAMDVAKMTLITSDLNTIPRALTLSRHTVQTIRQNLFWAFIYNLVGIPIAAGVLYPFNGFLLDPMIAGAAMALSSVSVVTNSLRLKWRRLP
ncbi:heavy metal translocating P-type ATPase [Flavihumibacter petaseus]|uniref:Copper-transporting P-type ATPase CopA n=1 Tax=Flavihumibacter petaseus NBRC 106054 TaxID=1220578 RepID=A0A0E9N2U4_9BACT|nr:heavy metal translocating P-type ATPase [Flavihumibacter petaseus]GAO43976.1 copper-transporting P-type ATPase CopA [Flavihumibacter petaseus NBRC 106054]